MIFLTDVDEVLADFAKHVCAQAKVVLPENCGWEIFDALTPEERERAEKVIDAPGFCESIPVTEESQEAIETVRRHGCEVFAVTTPWNSRTWHWERMLWLKREFEIDKAHVIATKAKHLVYGDFFLDDKPANVLARCRQPYVRRGHVMLWDTPYNRNDNELNRIGSCDFSPFERVTCWNKVVSTVERLVYV